MEMTLPYRIAKYPEMKVGDVVYFSGARFKITETEMHDAEKCESKFGDVITANGKWLDGQIIPGYFGPNRDWTFQGNDLATVGIAV